MYNFNKSTRKYIFFFDTLSNFRYCGCYGFRVNKIQKSNNTNTCSNCSVALFVCS